MFCPKCGREVAGNSKFCGVCGTVIHDQRTEAPDRIHHKEKAAVRQWSGWITPISILAVVMAAVGIFIFTKNEIPRQPKQMELNSVKQSGTNQNTTSKIKHNNVNDNRADSIIAWNSVVASSVLPPDNTIYYYPELVLDRDYSTAWVEGNPGDGIGEWIQLNSTTPQKVSKIEIANGYKKSQELYTKNNKIKKILIEFSDGTNIVRELSDDYFNNFIIKFDSNIQTQFIKFTILDVYKGTDYSDTCIAEIKTYH